MNRVFFILAFCLASFACTTPIGAKVQAALVSNPNEASFQEISTLIAKAVRQNSVVLAKNVFVDSSILVLSKPDMTGRIIDVPQRFRLLLSGERCLLEHMNTRQRWDLRETQCVSSGN